MENFVPFETAKKLKEKGFKEKCLAYYDVNDNVGLLYNTQYTSDISPCQYTDLLQSHNTDATIVQVDDSEYCVDAPTISQVLKWLREEKKIFIDIRTSIDLNGKEHFSYYIIHNKVSIREGYTDFDWKFEQAALAGIEYIIDNNLI